MQTALRLFRVSLPSKISMGNWRPKLQRSARVQLIQFSHFISCFSKLPISCSHNSISACRHFLLLSVVPCSIALAQLRLCGIYFILFVNCVTISFECGSSEVRPCHQRKVSLRPWVTQFTNSSATPTGAFPQRSPLAFHLSVRKYRSCINRTA